MRVLFLIFAMVTCVGAARFYVHPSGTATKANAIGPKTNAAACMPLATFNSSTFAADDTVMFTDTFTTGGIVIPSANVVYMSDDSALVDVSGIASNTYCVSSFNVGFYKLIGIWAKGGGGGACFRFDGTGDSIEVRDCHAISNYGAADAGGSHDGFSLDGSVRVTFNQCTANKCRESVAPFVGSDQAVTSHSTSKFFWYGGRMTDCNYFIANVETSHGDIYDCYMDSARICGIDAREACTVGVYRCSVTTSIGKFVDASGTTSLAHVESCTVVYNSGTYSSITTNVELIGNKITVGAMGGLRSFGSAAKITAKYNTITTTAAGAAFFSNGSTSQGTYDIQYNRFNIGASAAVSIYNNNDTLIFRNNLVKIYGSAAMGIQFAGTAWNTRCFIQNNVFVNTTAVASISINTRSAGTAAIQNNIFYGGTSVSVPSRATLISNNCYANSASNAGGADSVLSSPAFVDTIDYKITSTSPCFGAGTNVGVTSDYFGNPVPNYAGNYSIGWHEPLIAPISITSLGVAQFWLHTNFPSIDSLKIGGTLATLDSAAGDSVLVTPASYMFPGSYVLTILSGGSWYPFNYSLRKSDLIAGTNGPSIGVKVGP